MDKKISDNVWDEDVTDERIKLAVNEKLEKN